MHEIETVFVPLDGSERAEAALGAAVPLATRLGAELVLLSARWPNVAIESTRNYLDVRAAARRRRSSSGDVEHACRVVEVMRPSGVMIDGFDPADALVRDAGERHAAFLALASHGRSGLARTALGSVSMRTVSRASCPVHVAGPKSWERLAAREELRAAEGESR